MKRRDVLKASLAGTAALAAPRIVSAQGAAKTITFVPHADLASLDPVWTTADITRNYSLAVFDTLYAYDAKFNVQPQMVEGHRVEDDGKTWELTLRDGLKFHDGEKVLARDAAATVQRFGKRDPFGQALMKRVAEVSAPSDTVIRFRLNKPFPLLPNALAQVYCAIMPERLAKLDAFTQQIPEAIGSGPFKFVASERIPGQRVVFEKNTAYVPRKDGTPSFNAGPKIVNVDRVVWTFIQDPATASAALLHG
jgi:peptide/nickel transport system substrate-binding protein